MKRLWIVFAVLLGLVTVLPLGWWLTMVASGPTAAGPSEDPVVTWNREHEGLIDNGADHYLKAIELLHASAPADWDDQLFKLPLSQEVAAWLEGGENVVEEVRRGVAASDCWFGAERQSGLADQPWATGVRELARFLTLRSHRARERRDAQTVAECVVLTDMMARDAMEQPLTIPRLIGVACAAFARDEALAPLTWTELDAGAMKDYVEAIDPIHEPYASIVPMVEQERLEAWWTYEMLSSSGGFKAAVLVPRTRYYGEVEWQFEPVVELARQPVERHVDLDDPLRQESERRASMAPSPFQLARIMASITAPSLTRTFELRGRIVAMRRGQRAAIEVLARRAEAGEPPESLAFLDGQEFVIDPYTGNAFLYRRTDEGFILYSAGVDGDDDGGVHNDRFGEQRAKHNGPPPAPDGDYVLWPPQDRISVAEQGGERGGDSP